LLLLVKVFFFFRLMGKWAHLLGISIGLIRAPCKK
jgi:hypothetical protein